MANAYARNEQVGRLSGPKVAVSPSALSYALLALALLAMGWRATSLFTSPATPVTNSEFTLVADALIGPGKTRIVKGDTGTLLILIDGAQGSLSSATTTRLRDLATTLYPDISAVTIEQFEFADGLPGRPNMSALAELILLGCLVTLSGWLAFKRPTTPALQSIPKTQDPIVPPPAQPVLQHLEQPQAHEPAALRPKDQLDKAAALARAKPMETAAIIRKWLHQEESEV